MEDEGTVPQERAADLSNADLRIMKQVLVIVAWK
jgi:hypothetical protein